MIKMIMIKNFSETNFFLSIKHARSDIRLVFCMRLMKIVGRTNEQGVYMRKGREAEIPINKWQNTYEAEWQT